MNKAPATPISAPPAGRSPPGESALALARAVIEIEAQAVAALGERLDGAFLHAVDLLLNCRGRVVVSGIGKSGHIGRKIASTLASTGTPAMFVHAAEAAHGDLGMVTPADVFLAFSNSGSSPELMTIMPILKREGTPLIAVTGSKASPLAQAADVHLDCRVEREACPLNLAPTSSTTAMLALGCPGHCLSGCTRLWHAGLCTIASGRCAGQAPAAARGRHHAHGRCPSDR